MRPYLQAAPLALVLVGFLLVPLLAILVVSFWDYDSVRVIPAFTLENYTDVLGSAVTWRTYANTLKYAAMVWAVTLPLGFGVAWFLAFHVRSAAMQTALFLLCTVPFLTSNIIRMISWVPFLGRGGLVNGALLGAGVIDRPLEQLLFSDFAIVLAFVHLYALFMVVPVFNSMMRIDRRLIEAARDAGASAAQVMWHVIVPLCRPGIGIGTIFVVTLVMGDFITVRLMGGGQRASVGLMISNQISLLQYPAACANAVVLLAVVLLLVGAILQVARVREQL
ncbi:MAG: ABC transporter permease [Gemmatimonadaceae bacterium]|nr:ABC transporter permease [Acetobacteraceae bacterium]